MEKYRIPNLQKACQVLRLLSESSRALTIRTVAESLQIPRTTTLRILSTFTLEGLVRRVGDRYSLGPVLVGLGEAAKAGLDIVELSRPLLSQLAKGTGETCHLAVPSGNRALIAEAVLNRHRHASSMKQGTIFELHCTAAGKCLLAFAHWPNVSQVLGEADLTGHTKATITKWDALISEIEKVRNDGFACDHEESLKGIRRIAAPVFTSENQCIGAIGIAASTKRFPLERAGEMADLLMGTANELSRLLGWRSQLPSAD